MNVLVTKMQKLGLLIVYLVVGALIMAGAVILMPLGILLTDPTLLLNPYVLGVILIAMLFFALVGYFIFVRPYFLYRKTPDVQVEYDEDYLYIHGKKSAQIPLASLYDVDVYVNLPYILQKEFIAELIVHIFSSQYGDIVIDIPEYGSYKLRFVPNVNETANNLIDFLNQNSKKHL